MPGFDLSRWENDYASAPAERDNASVEVPDGKYQVRVARVELKESKQGNPMLEWELDIIGPRSAGRKLWRRNMLASAENVKWLKADLATCGVVLARLNDLNDERTLAPLIGVTLEVRKKTKGEYDNVYLDKRIGLGLQPPVSMPRSAKPAEPPHAYADRRDNSDFTAAAISDDDVPF